MSIQVPACIQTCNHITRSFSFQEETTVPLLESIHFFRLPRGPIVNPPRWTQELTNKDPFGIQSSHHWQQSELLPMARYTWRQLDEQNTAAEAF